MRRLLSSLSDFIAPLIPMLRLCPGTIGLIVCVCAALAGTEAWQLRRVYQNNIRQTDVMTSLTARSIAEQAEMMIGTADTIVASLVERVEAEGTQPVALARFYRLMTSLVTALPAFHELGITDAQGNAIVKARVTDPTGMNYADREAFRFHAAHPERSSFIGGRIKSKLDGSFNIIVTRRINQSDGSFGGVVVTSVSLQFFQQQFDEMQAKSGGIIALLKDDGSVLVRSSSIAGEAGRFSGGSELRQLLRDHTLAGSFTYTSTIDGVQRRGSYQRLNHYPLVTMVSQSEWDLQRGWRAELPSHAVIVACVIAVLAALGSHTIRANRVLHTQALQDGLTGLANRRCFDETIEREFRRARRTGQPLSIIMIDLDHFKDYNDCYGHIVGDQCLRAVAHAIQTCLRRAGDVAARYGGEEIAVVLPGTDAPRASLVAATMRLTVRDLALQHVRDTHGIVTFSAGVATCMPERSAHGSQALIA